jgi:hypothetical protein
MPKLLSAERRDNIRQRTIKGHYTRNAEGPDGHIIHPGGCSIELAPADFQHYSSASFSTETGIEREVAELNALNATIMKLYCTRDDRQAPMATQTISEAITLEH